MTYNHDVHRLLWIPAERRRLILQVDFLQGCLASQIVENQAAVVADGGDQASLARIEL